MASYHPELQARLAELEHDLEVSLCRLPLPAARLMTAVCRHRRHRRHRRGPAALHRNSCWTRTNADFDMCRRETLPRRGEHMASDSRSTMQSTPLTIIAGTRNERHCSSLNTAPTHLHHPFPSRAQACEYTRPTARLIPPTMAIAPRLTLP